MYTWGYINYIWVYSTFILKWPYCTYTWFWFPRVTYTPIFAYDHVWVTMSVPPVCTNYVPQKVHPGGENYLFYPHDININLVPSINVFMHHIIIYCIYYILLSEPFLRIKHSHFLIKSSFHFHISYLISESF